MKEVFKARALSIEEILDMLQKQGLTIEDKSRAGHILENVSYTRLKNYLVSLMDDRKSHRFKQGATFEQAYALYGFDRRLRELVFHEIEKIEISIRTHIAYASNGSEKGYWFLNEENFKSKKNHEFIMRRLRSELERSDNEAILHFKQKYSNEFPPSWLTLEAASFGTLAAIYEDMAPGPLKERVSEYFGLPDITFSSWLHHIGAVRNDCAHHNRFWNCEPGIKAALPIWTRDPFPEFSEKDKEYVYMTFCILKYLQDSIKPTNTFGERLATLLANFSQVDISKMGFPSDWQEHPLWKK